MATRRAMPPSRSDARALVFAVSSLVIAGIFVALVLFWGTRTDAPSVDTEGDRTFAIGPAETRYENLVEEGPAYVANPFGGDGFWLALEEGETVALVLAVPGRADCSVQWRGRDDVFNDCDGNAIDSTQLDRYEVVVPTEGDAAGQLVVNLDVVHPAPARSTS